MSRKKIKTRDRLKKYFSNIELEIIEVLKEKDLTEEEKVNKLAQKYGLKRISKHLSNVFEVLRKNNINCDEE